MIKHISEKEGERGRMMKNMEREGLRDGE